MPESTRTPSTKRWFLWMAGLLVGAYVSLATGAYWFVRYHRGLATVDYLDLALSWHWPGYQVKRGEHLIGDAYRSLQAGKSNVAFSQLRMGLAMAPANRDGRLLLAQFFAGNRRADLARKTLMDGLTYHAGDSAYVGPSLQFLLDQQEDREVIVLGEQLLKTHHTADALTEVVAMATATAYYYRGRYDRAEHILDAWGLSSTREARLLHAKIDWERGYRELALLSLRELNREFSQSEKIYVQLGDYLRSAGLLDEARRAAVLHHVAYPNHPRSAIDHLLALQQEGKTADLEQAAERTLHDFAKSQAGLLALGDFAASHGLVRIAQGVLQRFQENKFQDINTARLMVVESLLGAGRYTEALAQAQALSEEPSLGKPYVNVCSGLAAIAHYGLGDPVAGYTKLSSLMAQPDLRTASLLAIANRLVAMGNRVPAREVLAQAVNQDPKNQPALTRLIELDLETGNITPLPRQLRLLVKMRKPSRSILQRTRKVLRSDAYLFLPGRDALLDELTRALNPDAGQST